MPIQQRFQAQQLPFQKKWLIAVSGGMDSVVLCHLCAGLKIDFVMAHCNFQLRSDESLRDENFVKQLAKKYGVTLLVKHFDTQQFAADNKLSIQVAARRLRYDWFAEILEKETEGISKLDVLATAHHLDDNIETILMNFCKGTGMAGLRGILPVSGNIIRPLLSFAKADLQLYAMEQQLQWVEDSSNESDKYTRNYFRHRVIPVIEKVYPELSKNLLNNIERFREVETLYQLQVKQQLKKLLKKVGNEVHIPILLLQKSAAPKTLLFEATKDAGFTPHQLNDMLTLLEADNGKSVSSSTHRIFRNRKWLVIAALQHGKAENILIEDVGQTIQFPQGLLQMKISPAGGFAISTDNSIACINASAVSFPLLLRRWKTGDYFYPLGMPKKKKLSRFFIDQKLSKTEKEKVWVLETDKKIVWIIGMRIDDRFKITSSTKMVLKIEFKPV